MKIPMFLLAHNPEARDHMLFLCPHEKRYSTPLNEFTGGKEMVKLVCVPGNLHHIMVHRECTELAMHTTSAIIEWMLLLHSMGLSLRGKLRSRDLYVTASGQIKIKSSKRQALKDITPGGKMKDRQRIADIIEELLSGGKALPHDVVHLVGLLREGNDEDDIVLAKHPGPMRGIEKLSLLILLIAQMEAIKKRNPAKYKRIVKSLPFGNRIWIQRIGPLKYLMKVFNYKNRSKSYPLDASGMLLLERNGLAHLVEGHSITVKVWRLKVKGLRARKTRRNVKVHFTYNQISYMYGYAFPQALLKLQLILHREGEFKSIYKDE